MYSSKNYVAVEEALAQFDYIFKQLLLVHQEFHSLLEDDEKLADEEWFEEVDECVFTFRHKVCNCLKEAETEQSAKKSYSKKGSKSTSSGSGRKTKSSNSSGRSRCSKERAMEEKTRLAELMAKVEFMQQRQITENRAEQFRVQEKLAKAKARSEVYEAMERKGSEVDQSEIIRESTVEAIIGQQEIMHKHQVKSAAVDDNKQAPIEKISQRYEEDGKPKSKSTMKNTKNTEELSQIMCNLLRHQSAPNVEIETFTGNRLDYHYFMSVFKEAVEYKIDDPHGRLVRLLKYTESEARETIKHCIQQPVDIGYDRAKLLFEQHYGDPHRILAAYRKEIKGWLSLKPGDSSAYWKFYNFLIKCESIMSRQRWNSLNSRDILCTLTSKLPGNAKDKWNRKVISILRRRFKDPELADFIEFINDETLLASDPLFS